MGGEPLLKAVDPRALLGDKAFDADPFIAALKRRNISPMISPKANRKAPRDCDFALYANATSSSALLQQTQALSCHRDALR
jgi:hypothetical protein